MGIKNAPYKILRNPYFDRVLFFCFLKSESLTVLKTIDIVFVRYFSRINKYWRSIMKIKQLALLMGVSLLAACGGGDKEATDPTFKGVALIGTGGQALNSEETEISINVLKVGIDTSGSTLKLPVSDSPGGVEDTFPFIWVANSGENTISKLDTRTGLELGVYRTAPSDAASNPSRTTVDQDGNVWVGNRDSNTLVKVGLKEFGQCVDRNNNGVIDSSTGRSDIKAWTGTDIGGAEDECILKYVALTATGVTTPTDIRTVAIDPQNNVFAGGSAQTSLFKVNGSTGEIMAAKETLQGHYGGVVDKEGNIWSMQSGSGSVQKTTSDLSVSSLIKIGHAGYGVAIDKFGMVWTTEYGTRFSVFNPADPEGTLKVFYQTDNYGAQGIVTDDNGDIFIAGSLDASVVGHYKQVFDDSGVLTDVSFVANYPVEQGPTGVAVDGTGKVWASNYYSNSVSRIELAVDPINAVINHFSVGVNPYNYSDMTGRVVRTITNRQGTWEATFDGGSAGFPWAKVIWELQQALPEGTNVEAQVKAVDADSRDDAVVKFGAIDYVGVDNDVQLSNVTGRYLKLRLRLTSDSLTATPVITAVKIQ
jgi:streptogramin lyase